MSETTGLPSDPEPAADPVSYYQRNKERIKARSSAYQREHLTDVVAYHRRYRKMVREQTMAAYGGQCTCCGETELAFLTIDHIDGGGNAHRKEVVGHPRRGGERFYAWLRREGWPDGFRVRCWNCNSGAMMNGGICPHEAQP